MFGSNEALQPSGLLVALVMSQGTFQACVHEELSHTSSAGQSLSLTHSS